MLHHTENEKAFVETFRSRGGKWTISFQHGQPQLPKATGEPLSRMLRSGHIRRHSSEELGWADVCASEQP
jgi:hypothetical protein